MKGSRAPSEREDSGNPRGATTTSVTALDLDKTRAELCKMDLAEKEKEGEHQQRMVEIAAKENEAAHQRQLELEEAVCQQSMELEEQKREPKDHEQDAGENI
ncbi:unnamed protein product [Caretta caretta]